MSFKDYLVGRGLSLTINIVGLLALLLFLFSVGNKIDTLIIVFIAWVSILMAYEVYSYTKRKLYFKKVSKTVEALDKKYLISEVIESPIFGDGIPYYLLMKKARKSMLEELTIVMNQWRDYKEYIERWVHEVKTPISSIRLIEENNKNSTSREILSEIDTIDMYIEQALFYARSEEVEKDYLIKEISLAKSINEVIIKNKRLFILNNIDLSIDNVEYFVYSDSKWLEFILNQIIINSIKYRSNENPSIKIYGKEVKNAVKLIIEDNGVGIAENEITRVFEKGFTGNKGRENYKSTGIGLYLCKKLCDKLRLKIQIESEVNKYTKVIITFPKGSFCKI